MNEKQDPMTEVWRDRFLGAGYFFIVLAYTQLDPLFIFPGLICAEAAAFGEYFAKKEEKTRIKNLPEYNS